MKKTYSGPERREFERFNSAAPMAFKVCKKTTISKLLEGYTANVSKSGLLCNLKDKVKRGDELWLSFDKATLNICSDIERRSFIYQSGVIGKVVWVEPKKDNTFDVGIKFITREEKNLTNILPKSHFLKDQTGDIPDEEDEEEELNEEDQDEKRNGEEGSFDNEKENNDEEY